MATSVFTKLRTTLLWRLVRPLVRLVTAPLFPREAPWVVVRGPSPPVDEGALRRRWNALPKADRAHRFVLYRIIGNDLPPRHAPGQSLANLRTLLEHEPPLPGCEKRWVVNRIADPQAEAAVLDLLAAGNHPVLHLPFESDRYAEQPLDEQGVGTLPRLLPHDARERVIQRLCRFKNCYAVNNNGARNAALDDGVSRAPWVLPWDGNCMLTAEGWDRIQSAIAERPWYPYWIVPMARLGSVQELRPGAPPTVATEEPQIIFRRDAGERFNPHAYYGRRPKVELLWRLGVPGPWDRWYREPWDLPYPHYAPEAGAWQSAGWVARLPSGNAAADGGRANQIRRRSSREEAITAFLHRCDQRYGSRFPIRSHPLMRTLDR